MKDLIRKILKEEISNRGKDKLRYMVKKHGINQTSKVVGDMDNLLKILDINSPMDFLHLFDDMDVVQSEEEPEWTLFRYKPKHNLMVKNSEIIFIDVEIWSVLQKNFGLNHNQVERLTAEWLYEVYNISFIRFISPFFFPTGAAGIYLMFII